VLVLVLLCWCRGSRARSIGQLCHAPRTEQLLEAMCEVCDVEVAVPGAVRRARPRGVRWLIAVAHGWGASWSQGRAMVRIYGRGSQVVVVVVEVVVVVVVVVVDWRGGMGYDQGWRERTWCELGRVSE
jgi:hypothetical protein